MLTPQQFLQPLAARRTHEVVVTTMSMVRPWGALSSSPLDFASADSAMGHAADLALGIAIARPERKVVCLNGDGSMLMCLGTLATIVDSGVDNLILFIAQNNAYEITGSQPTPGVVNFAALASAAGIEHTFRLTDPRSVAELLPEIFRAVGPVVASVALAAGTEGPISRGPHNPEPYLRESLADSARRVRTALRGLS